VIMMERILEAIQGIKNTLDAQSKRLDDMESKILSKEPVTQENKDDSIKPIVIPKLNFTAIIKANPTGLNVLPSAPKNFNIPEITAHYQRRPGAGMHSLNGATKMREWKHYIDGVFSSVIDDMLREVDTYKAVITKKAFIALCQEVAMLQNNPIRGKVSPAILSMHVKLSLNKYLADNVTVTNAYYYRDTNTYKEEYVKRKGYSSAIIFTIPANWKADSANTLLTVIG